MLYPQSNAYRSARKLDGYWDFQMDPLEKGETDNFPRGLMKPRVIAVPASWNEQANELYHYHGRAWYQTRFALNQSDLEGRIVLRFSSVQYSARVYVNGKEVGCNDAPYLPFEWEVTAYVHRGENLLVLCVDGTPNEEEPVQICDFYGYAGIARPVFVCVLPKTYIADICVTAGMDGIARMAVNVQGERTSCVIQAQIDEEICVLKTDGACYTGNLCVRDVQLWSVEEPRLYSLHITLFLNGEALDSYCLKIGFRNISTQGRQILLNGKPILLKGFGRHEDFHILGKGLSHALNVRDFDLMKWTGANSFRTSHYPYSEEMLELADREGMLVISEAPFAGMGFKQFTNPATCEKAVSYMRRLIERDRNHPGIISFSIGNECQSDIPEAEEFFLPVIRTAKELDERPVTYVAWTKPEEDRIYRHVDWIGLNRYYGWYGYENWPGSAKPGDLDEALTQMEDCLLTFERLYDAPLLVTEFGADTIAGMHSTFMLQFTEEFQTRFLREYIRLLKRHPAVAGMHVWNFADFATEQSPGPVSYTHLDVYKRQRLSCV